MVVVEVVLTVHQVLGIIVVMVMFKWGYLGRLEQLPCSHMVGKNNTPSPPHSYNLISD